MGAPHPDYIKINFDASYDMATGSGGWGALARNAEGEMVLAAAGGLQNMQDVMHAEASALLKAIQVTEHFGMGRVIFQTDCLSLQQATASSMSDRNPLGVLFREAKFQL